MTRYSWEEVQDEVADLARIAEDIEKRTSLDRLAKHAPTDAPTLEFTREGIEQLQHDVITFLDQFDEMPQGLVDDICQTIINYYIKHRSSDPARPVVSPDYERFGGETPLNPSGDHKTI
jgi:hypothetical protein